jgi:hypothetical protein
MWRVVGEYLEAKLAQTGGHYPGQWTVAARVKNNSAKHMLHAAHHTETLEGQNCLFTSQHRLEKGRST